MKYNIDCEGHTLYCIFVCVKLTEPVLLPANVICFGAWESWQLW